jgi:hypothetical protein
MSPQDLEIVQKNSHFILRDLLFRKRWHRSKALSNLGPNEESWQGLIIQRRPQSGLSPRMTLVTVLEKHLLSPSLILVREMDWTGQCL